MKTIVSATGHNYPYWKGRACPTDLLSNQWLDSHGTQFENEELNYFYCNEEITDESSSHMKTLSDKNFNHFK